MHIAFCHHLSLGYYGGGEKWLIQLANELVKRGHDVEIYALPFLLDGKQKINPKELLNGIPYKEGLRHSVKADVCYVTYHPLSWLNFKTSRPRIAGIHSHAYWLPPHPNYGILPNLANITNRFTSYFELRRFDAIHTVTNSFLVNHPNVHCIPNFVDSEIFKPCRKDEKFSVGYISRKVWQKGFDVLRKVRKLSPEIQFNVSNGRIPENEMPQFVGRNHVTLVPSRVDTFGLSIVESMMTETPVITTPLITHEALELPLKYATHLKDFILGINEFREMSEYSKFAKNCRVEALKYDKKPIVNNLEQMFSEVTYNG